MRLLLSSIKRICTSTTSSSGVVRYLGLCGVMSWRKNSVQNHHCLQREREKERGEIKTTMEIQTRSYWDFMDSIHHTTHAHHPHDHMHNMTDGNRRDATWGWKIGRGGTYRTYIRTTGKIVSNLGEICNIYYSQQRALARTSHTNSYRRTVEHGRY